MCLAFGFEITIPPHDSSLRVGRVEISTRLRKRDPHTGPPPGQAPDPTTLPQCYCVLLTSASLTTPCSTQACAAVYSKPPLRVPARLPDCHTRPIPDRSGYLDLDSDQYLANWYLRYGLPQRRLQVRRCVNSCPTFGSRSTFDARHFERRWYPRHMYGLWRPPFGCGLCRDKER